MTPTIEVWAWCRKSSVSGKSPGLITSTKSRATGGGVRDGAVQFVLRSYPDRPAGTGSPWSLYIGGT